MLESFSLGGPLGISLNPLKIASFLFQRRLVLLLSQVLVLEGDKPTSGSPRHIKADNSNVVIIRSCTLVGILVFVVLVTIFASFTFPRAHSKLLLLLLELELLRFIDGLSRRILCLNEGQDQIKKEECTNEHHGHEEEERPHGVGFLVHDHDLGPALHRDALEHVEQGPEDVIKVSDIVVRIERLSAAHVVGRAVKRATDDLLAFLIDQGRAIVNSYAALLEHAHKEVETADGEDEEEEEEDDDRILEERDGCHH